jgi:AcrR family transcriptional regulator
MNTGTLLAMAQEVNGPKPPVASRAYRSPVRRERAEATRRAILEAARELFEALGYDATTVAGIADRAGVSVDTVYTSVGRKPQLVLAVIDLILGGPDGPVPAEQRDYVRALREEPRAAGKLALYARAVAELVPRVAPLQEALRTAGASDRDCARAWDGLVTRRWGNMLHLAAELRSTGEVRAQLTDEEIADLLWATNAEEFWSGLRQRGWTAERYERLLTTMWTGALLAPPPADPPEQH